MIIEVGKIREIKDENTYEALIDLGSYGTIECKALRFENEPRVDDEVIVFMFSKEQDSLGIYIPLKIITAETDFVGIARSKYKIEFTLDKGIEIFSNYNPENPDEWDTKISINGKNININNTDTNINLVDKKLNFNNGDTEINIDGSTVEFKGNQLTIETKNTNLTKSKVTHTGKVAPNGNGPFCGIPFCPFTGAPQTGDIINPGN